MSFFVFLFTKLTEKNIRRKMSSGNFELEMNSAIKTGDVVMCLLNTHKALGSTVMRQDKTCKE